MEIETSDAERNRANADVLSTTVESEIVSLEQMFSALESLKTEKDRLGTAVQNLRVEEAQILADGATSESAIVKKLIETRARLDVQNARLTSVQDKIREQTVALDVQGANVRRAFQFVVGRLYVSRETRMTATLTELFGGDWIILRDGKRLEMRHLSKQTQLMKQVRDFDVKVSHPIADPVQETAALQRTRGWLAEIREIVANEGPGLVLKVPAVHQPIEQPREMAAA